MSLATWDQAGILTREIALYQRLQNSIGKIYFVTYGDRTDADLEDRLGGIQVLCNRRRLPKRIYARYAAYLHAPALARCDIWKTNQTSGARPALTAKRLFRKPLIVRAGFMWSQNYERKFGADSQQAKVALAQERRFFRVADAVVVTAPAMRDYAIDVHDLHADKVTVIPNYVDVDAFPATRLEESDGRTIVFVGRLVPEKNVADLIVAAANLDLRLIVIGDGPEKGSLQAQATATGAEVEFTGTLAHSAVMERLRTATLFALPSLWEGQPKALLEAMALGLPVVGADSPGIRDLIDDGITGRIYGNTAEELRECLRALLSDAISRRQLGAAARLRVEKEYSANRVIELELQLYRSL